MFALTCYVQVQHFSSEVMGFYVYNTWNSCFFVLWYLSSEIFPYVYFITIKIILWFKHNFLLFLLVFLLYIAKIKKKKESISIHFQEISFSVPQRLNMPLVSPSAFPAFSFPFGLPPCSIYLLFPFAELQIHYGNHYFVRVHKANEIQQHTLVVFSIPCFIQIIRTSDLIFTNRFEYKDACMCKSAGALPGRYWKDKTQLRFLIPQAHTCRGIGIKAIAEEKIFLWSVEWNLAFFILKWSFAISAIRMLPATLGLGWFSGFAAVTSHKLS